MDTAASSSSPLQIVMFPWLAFGHLLSYLEPELLASRDHRVSFVSTPRNITRLPSLRVVVDLVALPFPSVEGGLPDSAESTNDVPGEQRELHWKAFDGLAEFLAAACSNETSHPHWIIADSFHHFVAASAVHHNISCAMLLPTAAVLTEFVPIKPSDDEPVVAQQQAVTSPPRYERHAIDSSFTNRDGSSGMSVVQRYTLTQQRCTIGAIRSCVEWEPGCFELVSKIIGLPVVPLGLLPPSADGGRRTATANREHATLRRLDSQPPNSVVYVALGSEVPLKVEIVHELALGLELAGTRFLWALRKPASVIDDDVLPPGFHDRTNYV